jgi:hypothetical protein
MYANYNTAAGKTALKRNVSLVEREVKSINMFRNSVILGTFRTFFPNRSIRSKSL